jgi:hypothetical protein
MVFLLKVFATEDFSAAAAHKKNITILSLGRFSRDFSSGF